MTVSPQSFQNPEDSPLKSYFTLRSTVVGTLCGLIFSLGRKYFSGESVIAPLLISLAFLAVSLHEGFWEILVKQKVVPESVLSQKSSNGARSAPRISDQYPNVQSMVGNARTCATEQTGSRLLQKAVSDKDPSFQLVFAEVLHAVPDLAMDAFGNYLVQTMLDHLPMKQREAVSQQLCNSLLKLSCSQYGIRCIQHLVDMKQDDEVGRESICHSLRGHICQLTRDINGNHVVQRILKRFPRADTDFVAMEIAQDLIGACSHPYGCCVMQLVLERCDPTELMILVEKLQNDTVRLAQCPYGNYVIQLLIGLKDTRCTQVLVKAMHGQIGQLSAHKFSSNVIEKCLQFGDRESKELVIKELVSLDGFERLLHDPYGNYVVQKAMSVAVGETLDLIMEAIRPLVDSLRAAPYGRRIYNKFYKHERVMSTQRACRDAANDMGDL